MSSSCGRKRLTAAFRAAATEQPAPTLTGHPSAETGRREAVARAGLPRPARSPHYHRVWPLHELQRRHHQVCGAVAPRCLVPLEPNQAHAAWLPASHSRRPQRHVGLPHPEESALLLCWPVHEIIAAPVGGRPPADAGAAGQIRTQAAPVFTGSPGARALRGAGLRYATGSNRRDFAALTAALPDPDRTAQVPFPERRPW